MKKNLFSFAVMLTGAALLTGCINSDDDTPTTWQGLVSSGAYVVCGGYQDQPGSLSYFEYKTETVEQQVFQTKNGRQLGNGGNDAIVYGSKMYIVMSDENTIEVVNPKTGASIRQINMIGLAGEQGVNPRHITAANGVVYVSTYGSSSCEYDENGNMVTSGNGYVVALDTLSFGMKNYYTVGSYPEGIYVTSEKLYVANSDNGAGTNASISIINLTSGAETLKKDTNIRNPQDVVALNNGAYFILDWGECDDSGKQMNAGVYLVEGDVVSKRIDNATMWVPISFSNGYYTSSYIYTVNAPKGSSTVTYERYDLASGSRMTFTTDGVFSPTALGVDPISGYVLIGSYRDGGSNQPDYAANGYVKVYDPSNGRCLKQFDCGVRPNAFVFNVGIETYTY